MEILKQKAEEAKQKEIQGKDMAGEITVLKEYIKRLEALMKGALENDGQQPGANEEESKELGQKRGEGKGDLIGVPNFIFIKGCKPGATVEEDTKLIRDTMINLTRSYEKETLTLKFPDVID